MSARRCESSARSSRSSWTARRPGTAPTGWPTRQRSSALSRYGLRYQRGGRIFGATVRAPSKDLAAKLRDLSFEAAEEEFKPACRLVEADRPAAITAACAIVETLCKQYLAEHAIELPA